MSNNEIVKDRNEPNGHVDENQSTMSFVDGTRTFSIAPVSSEFYFYCKGSRFRKTISESLVISTTVGLHYIYYDEDGVLAETTIGSEVGGIIQTLALCAIINWDGAKQILFSNERHGIGMSGRTHAYLHLTRGTVLETGGALTNFSVNGNGSIDAHAEFGVEASEIWDEDIHFSYTAKASTEDIPVYYLSGTTWRVYEPAGHSFGVFTTSGANGTAGAVGRAAYNHLVGGNWQLDEVTNNDFVLAHVFISNDDSRKFSVIMGQEEYATAGAARTGAQIEINNIILTGLPSVEFVFIGTIIYQSSNNYSNAVKSRIRSTDDGSNYIDLRDFRVTVGGSDVTITDHGELTGLLDDDHTQYSLLAGRLGGQTLIGGTASGDDLTLSSTSNATKGNIFLGAAETSYFDEVNNLLHIAGNITLTGTVDGVDISSVLNQDVRTSASPTFSTLTLSSTTLSEGIIAGQSFSGNSHHSGYAQWSHSNQSTGSGNYALIQRANNGTTLLNSPDYVGIRRGNSPRMNFQDSQIVVNPSSLDVDFYVYAASGEHLIHADAGASDIGFCADVLYVDGSTNRVGIGKVNPAQALDVNGNIAVSGTVDGIDISVVLDQDVRTIASPSFAGLTVAGTSLTGVRNDARRFYQLDGDFNHPNRGITSRTDTGYLTDVGYAIINADCSASIIDMPANSSKPNKLRLVVGTSLFRVCEFEERQYGSALSGKSISVIFYAIPVSGTPTVTLKIKNGGSQLVSDTVTISAAGYYRVDLTVPAYTATYTAINFTSSEIANTTVDIERFRVIETHDLSAGVIPDWVMEDEDAAATGLVVRGYLRRYEGVLGNRLWYAHPITTVRSLAFDDVPMVAQPQITFSNLTVQQDSSSDSREIYAIIVSQTVKISRTLDIDHAEGTSDRAGQVRFSESGFLMLDAAP